MVKRKLKKRWFVVSGQKGRKRKVFTPFRFKRTAVEDAKGSRQQNRGTSFRIVKRTTRGLKKNKAGFNFYTN